MSIWTLDIASGKITGSAEAGLMVGVEIEQPDIALEEFISQLHPNDQRDLLNIFTNVTQDKEQASIVECRVMVGSETRWVEIRGQALQNEAGEITQILGTILDITTRKKTAQEMIKLDRLKALGEMAAGVSHNLNNILTGILGPVQLLQLNDLDPKSKEEIDTIYQSGLRARDLVTRLYRGVGDIQEILEPVSVPRAITQAIQATQPRWKDESEAKGITIQIETTCPENLSQIRGTETGLHDILLNLIFNAIDAMPKGGILSVSAHHTNQSVHLAIRDTGTGMDEETLKRVFEPFFTTKVDVGTGLGLATVYGTITRWDGKIDVESQVGKGTTFNLHLQPWTQSDQTLQKTEHNQTARKGRILIVEDDKAVGQTLYRILSRDHSVSLMSDPAEVLNTFKADQFDIALIDLGLPGLPGDQLRDKIKNHDPNITTILITGWEMDETNPRRQNFDFYIQKPFADLKNLQEIIAEGIKLRDTKANA